MDDQVEAFGRAPQRPLRPIQSRLGTVRPAGQGRESGGGTGVFLPRVINNNEARKKHHSKFACRSTSSNVDVYAISSQPLFCEVLHELKLFALCLFVPTP